MYKYFTLTAGLASLLWLGCNSATEPQVAETTAPQEEPIPTEMPEPQIDSYDLPSSSETDPGMESTETSIPENTQLVEAEAGVGARGRGYGGGIYTEPLRQRFLIEHRIIFLNVERALQIFEAEHQRRPSSDEEFQSEIIEANDIQLPELPAGEYYVYDPNAVNDETGKTGMLMVARPQE